MIVVVVVVIIIIIINIVTVMIIMIIIIFITVTIRLSVKGFPAKASGLKLVNSVFNVVTFPTNYFD